MGAALDSQLGAAPVAALGVVAEQREENSATKHQPDATVSASALIVIAHRNPAMGKKGRRWNGGTSCAMKRDGMELERTPVAQQRVGRIRIARRVRSSTASAHLSTAV
jgi:hypothetical protein